MILNQAGGASKVKKSKPKKKKATPTYKPKGKPKLGGNRNSDQKHKSKKKPKKKVTPTYKPKKPKLGGNRNSDGAKKKKPAVKKKVTPSYKGGGDKGKLDSFIKAIKKGVSKTIKDTKTAGHHVAQAVTSSSKKPKTKPKAPAKPKVTSSYTPTKPLFGGNRNSDNHPKPKPTSKSNSLGQAGLNPSKYHGSTPKTTVPKSKVAPEQKKVPTRVPASTPKPKSTVKPKTTTSYVSKPTTSHSSSPVSIQTAYHAAIKPVVTKSTGGTSVVKPTATTKVPVVPKTQSSPSIPVVKTTDDMLRQMSLKALQGDMNAANYLKNNHLKAMTGSSLWKGYNTNQLHAGSAMANQYRKDNPLADWTKTQDMNNYNNYNKMIQNNSPMSQGQSDFYKSIKDKWQLEDYNDPQVQYQHALQTNQQNALNAQDVALNKGMATLDSNSFQQYQTLKQDMSNRGVSDSGISADAYMRAQMANNQNYQQAYSDAATAKSDIVSKYTDAIAQSKFDQRQYADERMEYADERGDAEAQNEIDQQNALAKIQEQQTAQDKFLTTSTGKVYLNGEMMLDSNGKPMTTIDMMKLQETNRHNTTTEDIAKQKLSVSQQKLNNDLAIATQKLQYNWASLDLKSSTAQANIANAQAKLELTARNGDTAEIKAQATILNNQLKNIQTQINGYNKKDKLTTKDKAAMSKLKTQLKSVMTKMSTLANMGK